MKRLEKIVKTEVLKQSTFGPASVCLQTWKGVADATLTILNLIHTHLEEEKFRAIILFVDFSSAFNTLHPHSILKKLLFDFELSPPLAMWILDFLLRDLRERV